MFTQFGQIVGTVDYMSPEQAKLNELDIDTRSDIHHDFVGQRADDPKLQAELAAAQYRMGRIYRELGEKDLSAEANAQAMLLYETLRQSHPDDSAIRLGLARACYYADEEEKTKGLDLRRTIVEQHPENPAYNAELALVLNNIAVQVQRQGKTQDALDMYLQAAGFVEKALAEEPDNVWYGSSLALYCANVAWCQNQLGRKEESLQSFQRAVDVLGTLARRNPAVPELKSKLYKC